MKISIFNGRCIDQSFSHTNNEALHNWRPVNTSWASKFTLPLINPFHFHIKLFYCCLFYANTDKSQLNESSVLFEWTWTCVWDVGCVSCLLNEWACKYVFWLSYWICLVICFVTDGKPNQTHSYVWCADEWFRNGIHCVRYSLLRIKWTLDSRWSSHEIVVAQ